ncbi:hypothetical protein V9J68_003426 [Vibrio cholerae]|nr:hypothetical protein [Vibrio cholerae]
MSKPDEFDYCEYDKDQSRSAAVKMLAKVLRKNGKSDIEKVEIVYVSKKSEPSTSER